MDTRQKARALDYISLVNGGHHHSKVAAMKSLPPESVQKKSKRRSKYQMAEMQRRL